jgi:iron(III) transport system permease protein
VGLFCLLSILPHLGVLLQSFSARWFLTVLPGEWTSSNYQEVFSLPLTISSLRNSLFYSGASALLDLVLGAVIAYLLAREIFPGKAWLESLAMIPLALPGLVSAYAYYVTFSRGPFPVGMPGWNHLWLTLFDPRQNPTFILIIAYSMHRLPYIVRSAYAGLQQTSVALEEASLNLGASQLRTMLQITLPLLGAYLIAGCILTFSFAMLDVSNGMMLAQQTAFYPLTKAIFSLLGRILPTAPSLACALGVLGMLFLAGSLWMATKIFGQKTGQLFKP